MRQRRHIECKTDLDAITVHEPRFSRCKRRPPRTLLKEPVMKSSLFFFVNRGAFIGRFASAALLLVALMMTASAVAYGEDEASSSTTHPIGVSARAGYFTGYLGEGIDAYMN